MKLVPRSSHAGLGKRTKQTHDTSTMVHNGPQWSTMVHNGPHEHDSQEGTNEAVLAAAAAAGCNVSALLGPIPRHRIARSTNL